MQVRDHRRRETLNDRAVLRSVSTEQHAHLSLACGHDPGRTRRRGGGGAAADSGVSVIAYGLTPSFVEYPGTVTLRMATLCALVMTCSMASCARLPADRDRGRSRRKYPDPTAWCRNGSERNHGLPRKVAQLVNAPMTWAKAMKSIRSPRTQSWLENFPWTRLADVVQPSVAEADDRSQSLCPA